MDVESNLQHLSVRTLLWFYTRLVVLRPDRLWSRAAERLGHRRKLRIFSETDSEQTRQTRGLSPYLVRTPPSCWRWDRNVCWNEFLTSAMLLITIAMMIP